jgi:hypothetical protein
MHGFVGHPDMQRRAIGVRVHRHAPNAHFAQRADHADRDLASVRNQDFAEHP